MDATKIFVTSKLGVAMLSVAALLGINAMNDAASTTNTMAWAWPWSSRSHLKAVCLELWGHFCLALLCVNVAYDLFIFAPLLWIFVRPLSKTVFHRLMTALINWTTYIVIGPPFAWCGMRAYVNDMPYFQVRRAPTAAGAVVATTPRARAREPRIADAHRSTVHAAGQIMGGRRSGSHRSRLLGLPSCLAGHRQVQELPAALESRLAHRLAGRHVRRPYYRRGWCYRRSNDPTRAPLGARAPP